MVNKTDTQYVKTRYSKCGIVNPFSTRSRGTDPCTLITLPCSPFVTLNVTWITSLGLALWHASSGSKCREQHETCGRT
jgi:hypothetical protein